MLIDQTFVNFRTVFSHYMQLCEVYGNKQTKNICACTTEHSQVDITTAHDWCGETHIHSSGFAQPIARTSPLNCT
jgi:hypothetical protein